MGQIEDGREQGETVVVMGDFNAIDNQALDAYNTGAKPRMTSTLATVLAGGGTDVFRMLHPGQRAITRETKGGGNRLDYVVMDPMDELVVCGAAVHVDAKLDTDHRPVLVDVLGVEGVMEMEGREGEVRWRRFMMMGEAAEREAEMTGGTELADFRDKMGHMCPMTGEEAESCRRIMRMLRVQGRRTEAVRRQLGEQVLKVQRAVVETMRRTVGLTKTGGERESRE